MFKTRSLVSLKFASLIVSLGLVIPVPSANSEDLKHRTIKNLSHVKRAIAANTKKPETPPTLRDKWALIIGVNEYKDDEIIDAVPSAVKSANQLAVLLRNPNMGRFAPDHVQILSDAQATVGGINQCLDSWLFKKALPSDLVIIYLAGRMAKTKTGEPVWLAYDSLGTNPADTGVKINEFFANIKRRTQSNFVVGLLDTNPLRDTSAPGGSETSSPDWDKDGAKPAAPPAKAAPGEAADKTAAAAPAPPNVTNTGVTLITATNFSEPSYYNPKTGVSFFVQYFSEAMQVTSGLVSAPMIYEYLRQNLPANVERAFGKPQSPGILLPDAEAPIIQIAVGTPVKSSQPQPSGMNIGHPVDKLALEHPEVPQTGAMHTPVAPGAKPIAVAAKPPGGGNPAKPGAAKPTTKPTTVAEDEEEDFDTELDFGSYMAKMKTDIQKHWTPPKGLETRRVVVTFTIQRDGQITNPSILEGSGLPDVDKSAMEALRAASPLTPLPKGAPKSVDIKYQFDWKTQRTQ